MGLFTDKYIVEFEYSNGFFSSYKKGTMVVEATGEFSAKDKAKALLKANYQYVKVLSAKKSTGKIDKKSITFVPPVQKPQKVEKPVSSNYSGTPSKSYNYSSSYETAQIDPKEIEKKETESNIRKLKASPIIALVIGIGVSLISFLFGWIPYWVFNNIVKSCREEILWCEQMGYDPNSEMVQTLYREGMNAKNMRDSVIWIPFVVLSVLLIVTAVIFILLLRRKKRELPKLENNINTES